jgi:predicted O-methyltransferase YrrM
MEHFNESIIGWFTFPRLYSDMANKFPSGSTFVEVGTYEGKSFSYLVVEALNAGKEIKMYAVDSFTFHDEHKNKNILDVFIENMMPVDGKYEIIVAQSWKAADCFEDKSLDFVFLDADHVAVNFRKDVLAWLPKIKPGGIIAGHDYCDPRYYDNEHPGVAEVVHEIFGDDWDKSYLDEKCWVKHIK